MSVGNNSLHFQTFILPLIVIIQWASAPHRDQGCISQKHHKPKLIIAPLLSMGLRCTWMNEWGIYIALYCVLLYTQKYEGVSLQPPPVCSIHLDDATAATAQRRQCAHHTPATGGEEREIEPIKWMGIIGRPWLTRASGGNLESGPRFNVSSERRCSFDSIVSPSLYWGIRTHTDHRVSTPCWPH